MTRSQFLDKWTGALNVMLGDLGQTYGLRFEMSRDLSTMEDGKLGSEFERGKRAGAIPDLEKYITELHRLASDFAVKGKRFLDWELPSVSSSLSFPTVAFSADKVRDFRTGYRLLVVLAAAHLGVDPDELSLSDFMGHAEKIYGQLKAVIDAERKEEEER